MRLPRVKRSGLRAAIGGDMVRRAQPLNYSLDSIDRMSATLLALETAPDQPLEQVARLTGLNESTALRYLLSLSKHGFVERDEETGTFRLGLELFRLGTLAMESRNILSVAGPVMSALRDRFGESVNLAANQQDKVVLIQVLGRPDSINPNARRLGRVGSPLATCVRRSARALRRARRAPRAGRS